MIRFRLVLAWFSGIVVLAAGCSDGGNPEDRAELGRGNPFRELESRPVELPRVEVPDGVGRAARQFRAVAGHCWSWGAPDVGAIALPGIPGEAALGPWPRSAGPTVSGSGPGVAAVNRQRGEDVLKRGPVYAALLAGPPRIVYLSEPPAPGESKWRAVRTIWVSRPSYHGPLLVRGGRLDRPGRVGFGSAVRPRWELRLPAGSWPHSDVHPRGRARPVGDRWRASSVPTRILDPGCYAFQVDGVGFSYVLAFGVQGG